MKYLDKLFIEIRIYGNLRQKSKENFFKQKEKNFKEIVGTHFVSDRSRWTKDRLMKFDPHLRCSNFELKILSV